MVCRILEYNKLYFTFYPDFDVESEAFNLDEGKGVSKDYYISIPSFLFIQIYDRKEEIIKRLKEQIIVLECYLVGPGVVLKF